MIIRYLIVIFIALVLFFVLKNTINFNQALEAFENFPKQNLALILTISLIISFIKSYRFFKILRYSEVNINFPQALKAYLAGGVTSALPAGEAMRASLLKHGSDVKIHHTSGPVLIQAYIEVLSAVLILAILSIFFKIFVVSIFIALIITASIFIVLSHSTPLRFLLEKSPDIKNIKKVLLFLKDIQKSLRENFLYKEKPIPNFSFVNSLLISFITHILGGALPLIIVNSLGGNINYFQGLYIYTLSIVVSSIGSISPGGLGFTEGAVTAALLFFGVDLPIAIISVLIFRIATLVFNIALGLLFLAIFYRSYIFRFN